MSMLPPSNILLEVDDLAIQFKTAQGVVRAVDGVSLSVQRGEAVGIVGESGSGKSMTALALTRLVPPPGRIVKGTIRFDGKDMLQLGDEDMRAVRMSEIAVIFQDAGSYLNPIITIYDQISEAIGRRGARDAATRQMVLDALKSVQIADPERIANSYPYELSGGMQQRALIASVLIRQPQLIIADEPTTALDATVQHQILKFLAQLRSRYKAALILISHDLAVIAQVCERVMIMYGGQIVESGATAEIFRSPKHPYTQALLDSILDPWVPKAALVPLEGSPPDMSSPPPGCRFHPRCARAFARCAEEEPPQMNFEDDGMVRCWLHAENRAVAS